MKVPIVYQRVESGLLLVASVILYLRLGYSPIVFLLLLFTMDVSMVGYLHSSVLGAHIYNIGHSLTIPLVLVSLGFLLDVPLSLGLGLIWASHVGLDRALGYGLKLPTGFSDTHLGKIGKGARLK